MLMIGKAVSAWRTLISGFCTLQKIQFSAPWGKPTKC